MKLPIVAIAGAALLSSGVARATSITLPFSAIMTAGDYETGVIDGSGTDTVTTTSLTGDTITGSITFNNGSTTISLISPYSTSIGSPTTLMSSASGYAFKGSTGATLFGYVFGSAVDINLSGAAAFSDPADLSSFNPSGVNLESSTLNFSSNYGMYYKPISDLRISGSFTSLGDANLASAVPETATWVMMILGFGAVGVVVRCAHRKSEERITRKVRSLANA